MWKRQQSSGCVRVFFKEDLVKDVWQKKILLPLGFAASVSAADTGI